MNDGPPQVLAPARVLAWSDELVSAAVDGPGLFLWRPSGTTVALGLSQKPEVELDVDAMQRDGIGLVRRQSGGGAVVLTDGVLCWEAWSPLEAVAARQGDSGIRQCYAFLSGCVAEALRSYGLDVRQAGICDLSVVDGGTGILRKIAGTAQLRRRQMVLVHGSLLVDPDMDLLGTYLRFPSAQPEYRRGRSHRDFCLSLAEALGGGKGQAEALCMEVSHRIYRAAAADGWAIAPPIQDGVELPLEGEKYRNPGWNWRRERPSR